MLQLFMLILKCINIKIFQIIFIIIVLFPQDNKYISNELGKLKYIAEKVIFLGLKNYYIKKQNYLK